MVTWHVWLTQLPRVKAGANPYQNNIRYKKAFELNLKGLLHIIPINQILITFFFLMKTIIEGRRFLMLCYSEKSVLRVISKQHTKSGQKRVAGRFSTQEKFSQAMTIKGPLTMLRKQNWII